VYLRSQREYVRSQKIVCEIANAEWSLRSQIGVYDISNTVCEISNRVYEILCGVYQISNKVYEISNRVSEMLKCVCEI
jgi:hypothetical protein